MAGKTADDLVAELAGLGEEIVTRAAAETRTCVAREIKDQMLGTPRGTRATYDGANPDARVVQALAEWDSLTDARLQAALARFEDDGVTEDFRAGALFADLGFDY